MQAVMGSRDPNDVIDVLRIAVTDANGTRYYDPNGIIMSAFQNKGFTDLQPRPEVPSELCGSPSIAYETDQVKLNLTLDQLYRLVTTSLSPDEWKTLYDKHGNFFEIHDDFYDFETGVALQPRL